jgi:hypothetical protein
MYSYVQDQVISQSRQKTASAAANGSFEDLRQLLDHVRDKSTMITRLFLPAFYAQLNPAKAQRVEEQEVLADAKPVVMAFAAVQGLSGIRDIPREAHPELWHGLSRWSQLIMKYDDRIPPFTRYRRSEVTDTSLFSPLFHY